jgi:hypothetical protein
LKLEAAIALGIGVSVPILLGLLTYAYQERQRRTLHLAEHKERVYATLIRNLVELLGTHGARERSHLLTEIEKSWLFASDEVLEASYGYIALYDKQCRAATEEGRDWSDVLTELRSDPANRKALRDQLARVFAAMRRDLRSDTKLEEAWALEHFDIYCWGILAAVEERAANSAAGSG